MADWVNIIDTAIDPDAPLTSELAYAWRDNPIAIAEGAAGAPRITSSALLPMTSGTATVLYSEAAVDVPEGVFYSFSALSGGSFTFSKPQGSTSVSIIRGSDIVSFAQPAAAGSYVLSFQKMDIVRVAKGTISPGNVVLSCAGSDFSSVVRIS